MRLQLRTTWASFAESAEELRGIRDRTELSRLNNIQHTQQLNIIWRFLQHFPSTASKAGRYHIDIM